MRRRAQFGVLVAAFIIFATAGLGVFATANPVATVHLTEGWATFGQAVPEGAAVSGLQVGDLPTQTDVKTRWPGGSIRFAIVTARILAEGDYPVTSAPLLTGINAAPFPGNVSATLIMEGSPQTATRPVGAGDPWLAGPLVTERRHVVAPVTADGVKHAFLRVNFDTRAYNDGDARVDVSVENVLNQAGATTVTYDVVIDVNGTTRFSKTNVQHYYLTRWRQAFELGTFAAITPDMVPLNLARALPPYLSLVANTVNVIEPADAQAYEILREGVLNSNMSDHGGRPELAPFPDWTARYLVHKNPVQRSFVLAHGDLSGSWPVHVREPEGGALSGVGAERFVSLEQRPNLWFDLRAEFLDPSDNVDYIRGTPLPFKEYTGLCKSIPPGPDEDGCEPVGDGRTRLIPDNAHQPSLAYVPYLLTGDRYYAEEMAFWANYGMLRTSPADGVRGGLGILENQETRGYGWALRNLVDAAAYYPDSSPVRAYLSERVEANLQWLDQYANSKVDPVTNPLHLLWVGYRDEPGYTALWEQNYLAYAIDRANKQGFAGGLAHRDAIAKLQLKLFTSGPAYPRTTILADATHFDFMGQTLPAGAELPWGAPYLLAVATVHNPDRWWEPANHTIYTTLEGIAAATTADPHAHRPYPGFYGPEARLNLMIGVEENWPEAQAAYDYLFPFLGVQDSSCVNEEDRPDLSCRAGWALDFHEPHAPPPADDDADDDGINDDADNCPAVPNADQLDTDTDTIGNACDDDDDNDGTPDTTDAFPLNANESVDTDGDAIGDNADPDDDNDQIPDGSDPFPLVKNRAPSVTAIDDRSGVEDIAVSFTIGGVDPDGDSLTFLSSSMPPGVTLAPSGAVFGAPTTPGTYTVNVVAFDGYLSSISDTFTWKVNPAPEAPIELTNPGDQIDTEGEWVSLQLDWAADARVKKGHWRHHSRRPIHFSASGLPKGLHIHQDGTISGKVGHKAAGVYREATVTLRVGKEKVSRTFVWTILNKNRPPRLHHISDQVSNIGSTVELTLSATDPDHDTLTFTHKGLPPGLVMSSGGVISGRMGGVDKEYHVTVTVSDGKSHVSRTFHWTAKSVKKPKEKGGK